MNEKKINKLIRKYCKWWTHWLGLGHWIMRIVYSGEAKSSSNGGDLDGEVVADWRYLTATITFYPANMKTLSKTAIERIVVHELVHILVNEMREDNVCHEERVVTQLQRAFVWVKGTTK